MDIPVIKKEIKALVEQKLHESGSRLSALSEWLYENTSTATGSEYDAKVAAYHTELRRYDALEEEYKELTGERMPEKKKEERNERGNNDKKYKVKY